MTSWPSNLQAWALKGYPITGHGHVGREPKFISHQVFPKSFCISQFSHKSVNLIFTLVIVKDKLTDLWGS